MDDNSERPWILTVGGDSKWGHADYIARLLRENGFQAMHEYDQPSEEMLEQARLIFLVEAYTPEGYNKIPPEYRHKTIVVVFNSETLCTFDRTVELLSRFGPYQFAHVMRSPLIIPYFIKQVEEFLQALNPNPAFKQSSGRTG